MRCILSCGVFAPASTFCCRARLCDPDAGPKLRAAMMKMLPVAWQNGAPTHLDLQHGFERALEANGQKPTDDVQKGINDFNSVWLVGSKAGTTHHGTECSGLACLRLCDAWTANDCRVVLGSTRLVTLSSLSPRCPAGSLWSQPT